MKMKITQRVLSLISILSVAFFANCGGDGNETAPEKVQLGKLKGTWELVNSSSATFDGSPSAQIESDFTLTLSGTFNSNSPEGAYDYAVTGTLAPSPWPASGTWLFNSVGPGNTGTIARDDAVAVEYTLNSSGELIISFTCSACDYAGARANNINGDWVFTLQKQ
jgi:hypothetical protein